MKMHSHEGHIDEAANFPTAVAGLAEAVASEVLDLADGDTIDAKAPAAIAADGGWHSHAIDATQVVSAKERSDS